MDDDLGVSGALAVVHEAVTTGNTALDDGDHADAAQVARVVIAMTDVLGVNPSTRRGPPVTRWPATPSRASTPSSGNASRPGPRPGPPVTTTPRTPSATSSPPPASRSRTPLPGPAGPSRGDGASDHGRELPATRRDPQLEQEGPDGRLRWSAPAWPRGQGPDAEGRRPPEPQGAQAGQGGRPAWTAAATAGRTSTRKNKASSEMVAGRNSVLEALRADVPVTTMYVAGRIDSDDRVREALKIATERGIPVLETPRGELDWLTDGAVHQGLALQVPPTSTPTPATSSIRSCPASRSSSRSTASRTRATSGPSSARSRPSAVTVSSCRAGDRRA